MLDILFGTLPYCVGSWLIGYALRGFSLRNELRSLPSPLHTRARWRALWCSLVWSLVAFYGVSIGLFVTVIAVAVFTPVRFSDTAATAIIFGVPCAATGLASAVTTGDQYRKSIERADRGAV
jgi:hypothetical protein